MEAEVPNAGNAGISDEEYKIFSRKADWHKYLATHGKFTQSRLAIDLFLTGHPAPSEKGSQAERGPHA
jgi:hypothetical protein